MSNLIPLSNNDGDIAVMGRDLHAFLGSREPYTRWIARHIEKYGFSAGQDFMTKMSESTGGRPSEDHVLTLDMAKEISMLQANERGKQARQYFIECEKQHQSRTPALPDRRALAQMVIEAEDRAELEAARADKAEHKAEILTDFKRAHEAGDGITVSDFGRKYFSEEQYMQVFNHLYKHDYLIDQRGTRTTRDGKKKDGYDHMKPKAKGRKYFYLHEKGTHGGQRRNQTRVRPQMEIALRDALIADGLTPNTHSTGLVLFNTEDMKELSA